MSTKGDAANNRCICANAGTLLDNRCPIVFATISRKRRPRRKDVGEDDRGTTKNVVLKRNAFVDRNVILNFLRYCQSLRGGQ